MANNNFPNWLSMLELWMKEFFPGSVCVVFANPQEHIELLKKYFTAAYAVRMISAEYAILVCDDAVKTNKICNSISECYVMVWDRGKMINENT